MRDLRDVLTDRSRLVDLTAEEAASALVELAGLQATLAAHLRMPDAEAGLTQSASPEINGGRLLTPAEAAERLGVKVPWLYRHSDKFTFTRHLSRKVLRFWEPGLEKYLREKRA